MDEFTISLRLTVRRASVGPMDNNAYFLVPESGAGVLIDAAADPDALTELVGDVPVSTIVTTHRHHDHIQALAPMVRTTGAVAIAGRPDADAIALATGVRIESVWSGDTIDFGDLQLGVIGLVGHTPGSITLVADLPGAPVHLFTGDALFPGGVGRTTSPQDFTDLFEGVFSEIFDRFDDDTVVHPGHGVPTTLGAERPHLADWRARGW